jgi:AcrR family transcriptional regulator
MSGSVKRNYASTLRAEQARATRRAIVEAARRLFIERGYGATTVDAIAEAASVSRKTVFTSVGGKLEALKLARDWAIVGDDEPVPVMERPEVQRARKEPDARVILRSYAGMVRRAGARVAALNMVIEAAEGLDAGARALAEEGRRQRLTGMRDLAEELARRNALPDEMTVDEAADVLWLFNDARAYHRLVIERGWMPDRFEQWLADSLLTLLIRPDYTPSPKVPTSRPTDAK